MLWAQISLLALIALGLLLGANQHGKPKKGVESFWTSLLANAIFFFLLYCAGGLSRIFHF